MYIVYLFNNSLFYNVFAYKHNIILYGIIVQPIWGSAVNIIIRSGVFSGWGGPRSRPPKKNKIKCSKVINDYSTVENIHLYKYIFT